MRLFVAATISDAVIESLKKFIAEVKQIPAIPPKTKWVKPENIHLTLKFLGEIEENSLEPLENSLSKSVDDCKNFSAEMKGVGIFPDFRRARILWIAVQDGQEQLENLAKRVEESTISAGFPPMDKPFSAHCTIARFTLPPSPTFLEKMKGYKDHFFGRTPIEKINLIQSHLTPSGPRYTILKEFFFHAH